ncbi:hypothetical protein [Lacunimicrobium album]
MYMGLFFNNATKHPFCIAIHPERLFSAVQQINNIFSKMPNSGYEHDSTRKNAIAYLYIMERIHPLLRGHMQAKSFQLLRTRKDSPLFNELFARAIYSYLLQLEFYNCNKNKNIKMSVNKLSKRLGISRNVARKKLLFLESLNLVQVVDQRWCAAEQQDQHFYKKAVEHAHYFSNYVYDKITKPDHPLSFKVNVAFCVMRSRKEKGIKYTIRGMCRILGLDRATIRKAQLLINKANPQRKFKPISLDQTCIRAAAAIFAACLQDSAEESTILSAVNVIASKLTMAGVDESDLIVVINSLAKDFTSKKPRHAADALVDYVENHFDISIARVKSAEMRSLPAAMLSEIRGALGLYLKKKHNFISGEQYPPPELYAKSTGLLPRHNHGYWNKIAIS